VEVNPLRAPFQDGVTVIKENISLAARLITVSFTIKGASRADAYGLRREIGHLLSPKFGLGTLTYTNDYGAFEIGALAQSSPLQTARHKNYLMMNAVFWCPDPYFQEITDRTAFLQQVRPVFHFSFHMVKPNPGLIFSTLEHGVAVINNTGDANTGVMVSFYGPSENPVITNLTTGEFIKVNTSLSADQRMVITTGFGKKRVLIINPDGSAQDALVFIDYGSSFWQLIPGVNEITFDASVGSDNASVSIDYRLLFAAL
jgi:hypothetical protein